MEPLLQKLQSGLSAAWARAYDQSVDILPQAVLAILVVIGGMLIGALVHSLTVRVCNFFAVDKLVGKTPLDRFLKDLGIHKSVTGIIALLLFWMTVLLTLIVASDLLHLTQVSRALTVVTGYIPQVVAAILILVFGMLLAKFLQTLVTQAVRRAELGYEHIAGRAVYVGILAVVLLVASQQLGFELSFITTNVAVVLLAILFLAGFAVILGSRKVLEQSVACREVRREIRPGSRLRIQEIEGQVAGFTLTGVILEQGGSRTVVPAGMFLKHPYTVSS